MNIDKYENKILGEFLMTKSEMELRNEIKNFIDENGGSYKSWYVGISSDPAKRLFNEHNVDEKNDVWIYDFAFSADVARKIEDYFVNYLGTDGGTGGGDEYSKGIYAYKKNSRTNP
jgi:hypothetical protein